MMNHCMDRWDIDWNVITKGTHPLNPLQGGGREVDSTPASGTQAVPRAGY